MDLPALVLASVSLQMGLKSNALSGLGLEINLSIPCWKAWISLSSKTLRICKGPVFPVLSQQLPRRQPLCWEMGRGSHPHSSLACPPPLLSSRPYTSFCPEAVNLEELHYHPSQLSWSLTPTLRPGAFPRLPPGKVKCWRRTYSLLVVGASGSSFSGSF